VGWSRPFGPSSTSSPVAESSRASALASGRRKRERPQSLNDEQKARLNALGAEDNRDQQQLRRDLTQVCSERASGIASLPGGPISTAREGNFSKFFDSLNPLRGAARRAVEQLTKGSATSNGSTSSSARVARRSKSTESMLTRSIRRSSGKAIRPALNQRRYLGCIENRSDACKH
jgi:hypothetical protein